MPGLYPTRNYHHKKRQWHVFRGLFFIFVFSLAVFVFLQSSFFRVRRIAVNGNKQLEGKAIVTLAGLHEGVNIFRVNLQQARDNLSLNPMIAQAEIARDFPDTIVITVKERDPVGLVPDRGQFVVVGNDGYCLSRAENLRTVNLPFITGVRPDGAAPGRMIPDERIKAALAYLLAMPLNVRAAVSEINVTDLNNIRMFTVDGTEVRLGDAGRIADKIKLYREVISQRYPDKIQYIDISYRGSPVVKLIDRVEQDKTLQP